MMPVNVWTLSSFSDQSTLSPYQGHVHFIRDTMVFIEQIPLAFSVIEEPSGVLPFSGCQSPVLLFSCSRNSVFLLSLPFRECQRFFLPDCKCYLLTLQD